ncbi:MAG TPA: dTDP-4-dehydrorhamnose 3,5-epimerase [Acidimicrobiales bacterium]|nr:dTDP-4-dehydrorhamnose 3,5-epimerase [Acidimicrobiales bacterium]
MPVRPFQVEPTEISGLNVIEMKQVSDERGTVRELFRSSDMEDAGFALARWAQVNVTASRQGVVRGLHGEEMTKLVTVVAGSALGAYLDARRGSETFGRTVTVDLRPGRAVLLAPGICNGFQATADGWTEYFYCFDREWQPGMEGVAVNAFDPALGIPWPLAIDGSDRSLLSEKDAALPMLADIVTA